MNRKIENNEVYEFYQKLGIELEFDDFDEFQDYDFYDSKDEDTHLAWKPLII